MKPEKTYRLIFGLFGLITTLFGAKTAISQKIVTGGKGIFGAPWSAYGTHAIIIGVTLIILGSYMIYLALPDNKKHRKIRK